ncbi:MAG: hypothetical protein HYT79_04775 [Elusimicrobia bacterium]|nr:hypothetical protein [Elusimicrobiota bacterium]
MKFLVAVLTVMISAGHQPLAGEGPVDATFIEIHEGGRWRPHQNLRFDIERFAVYEQRRYSGAAKPTGQLGAQISGHWGRASEASGKAEIRVVRLEIRPNGAGSPRRWGIVEIVEGSPVPRPPGRIALEPGLSQRVLYQARPAPGAAALKPALTEGAAISARLIIRIGNRMGRVVLPLTRLVVAY